MLGAFGRWFSSRLGVVQTAALVLAWVLSESLGWLHDPQHFQLMVWLTIYSAVTQPVLAWVNNKDSVTLQHIEDLEKRILEKLDNM